MNRALKNRPKATLLALPKFALRLGIIILPKHYYTGVPDLNLLNHTRATWAHPSELPGIEHDVAQQERRPRETCLPFATEYRGNNTYIEATESDSGPGFGYIEAQVLHAFVRYFKPSRIIEVGSGVSTYCLLAASQRNREEGGPESQITSIEPYPRAWLRRAPVRLIENPVQQVSHQLFETLGSGDLLFIDSSHSVQTAGDVNFLVLEVLPRLSSGVFVHFHDIYLPYDYPRDATATLSQAQETAFVHAFLIANKRIKIVFCLSHLHYSRQFLLRELFLDYLPQGGDNGLRDTSSPVFGEPIGHFPSSLYLQIVLDGL